MGAKEITIQPREHGRGYCGAKTELVPEKMMECQCTVERHDTCLLDEDGVARCLLDVVVQCFSRDSIFVTVSMVQQMGNERRDFNG